MHQFVIGVDVDPEAAQQCGVRSDRSGIFLAESHGLALERQEIFDISGLGRIGGNDELLDILPQHRHRAQVFLRSVGLDRTGSGGGVITEQPLQNGELCLAFTQEADIFAGSGGVDRRHADFLLRLQLDLGQGGECHADRIVGSARRGGGQNVVSFVGGVGRERQYRRGSKCRQGEAPGALQDSHDVLPVNPMVEVWLALTIATAVPTRKIRSNSLI